MTAEVESEFVVDSRVLFIILLIVCGVIPDHFCCVGCTVWLQLSAVLSPTTTLTEL